MVLREKVAVQRSRSRDGQQVVEPQPAAPEPEPIAALPDPEPKASTSGFQRGMKREATSEEGTPMRKR